jgi:hypothetical protein
VAKIKASRAKKKKKMVRIKIKLKQLSKKRISIKRRWVVH